MSDAIVGEKVRGIFARLIEFFWGTQRDKKTNERTVSVGKRYRHYKGKEYTVLAVANHSETLEKLVIYRAEYDMEDFGPNSIWARPQEMFEGKVTVDGEEIDRFTAI